MPTVIFVAAFFRAAPPVTRPIVMALWAVAAAGCVAMAAGLAPGRTVLTPLLVLQIFAASSGFGHSLRRGYYDLLLARGVPAIGMLTAHWVASIAPGVAAWLLVAPFASAQSSRSADAAPKSGAAALNLNTATAAQLEALPGIGARTAQLIVEYRQKNGGFKKVEDLMNVKGIGEKSFLKLKPHITVTPAKE